MNNAYIGGYLREQEEAKIVRVIDGDTFICKIDVPIQCFVVGSKCEKSQARYEGISENLYLPFEIRVRMEHIDAHPIRTELGRIASDKLKRIFKDNDDSIVLIPNKKKRDPYGRVIASVIVNGDNLNLQLLDIKSENDESLWIPYEGKGKHLEN